MALDEGNLHFLKVADLIDIRGRSQGLLPFTNAANQTAALTEGFFDLWSDQDCYIAVSASNALGVTSSNGYLLRATNTIPVKIREGDLLGAIRSATNGTVSYHQIG